MWCEMLFICRHLTVIDVQNITAVTFIIVIKDHKVHPLISDNALLTVAYCVTL